MYKQNRWSKSLRGAKMVVTLFAVQIIVIALIWSGLPDAPGATTASSTANVQGQAGDGNTSPAACAGTRPACSHPQATSSDFLTKYGDKVYRNFQDIPLDLQSNVLYWCFKAERDFDLPCEVVLAIWYGEESHQSQLCVMSTGVTVDCVDVPAADQGKIKNQFYGRAGAFKPLQTAISTAGAVGPGQITAGFLKEFGHDLDENGIIDITSIADNIGTTAAGTVWNGDYAKALVGRTMRANQKFLADVVVVMRMYNGGPAAMYINNARLKTVQYADAGVRWIVENQQWLWRVETCADKDGIPVGQAGEDKIQSCLVASAK